MADLNADGWLDVAVTTGVASVRSLVSVLLNDGVGQFAVDAVMPAGYEPGRQRARISARTSCRRS